MIDARVHLEKDDYSVELMKRDITKFDKVIISGSIVNRGDIIVNDKINCRSL